MGRQGPRRSQISSTCSSVWRARVSVAFGADGAERQLAGAGRPAADPAKLAAEIEARIAALVASGATNAEVARALSLTTKTVA
jgi:DNA-binding NarL/FixJ family response regulator